MRKTWIEWGIKRSRVVVGVLNYCRLNWIIVLAPALPGVLPSRILAHWGLLLGVRFEFAPAAACVVCSCCFVGIRLAIWRYWLQDIILSQHWRIRILTQWGLLLGVCFEFALAAACFNQGKNWKTLKISMGVPRGSNLGPFFFILSKCTIYPVVWIQKPFYMQMTQPSWSLIRMKRSFWSLFKRSAEGF